MARTKGDKGAPAALIAIEEHEAQCRHEKDVARDLWKAAQAAFVEGDEVSERANSRTRRDYLDALEIWDDATKKLALFDKAVAPEKREGEKILRTDAQEIFAQIRLSLNLGLESYIIRACDMFAQPMSQEEAHKLHAASLRDCFRSAIDSAKRDGALPEWIVFE